MNDKSEKLERLIKDLDLLIKTKDISVSKIKHPELLIESLKELNNDIIGMKKLKDSVAVQTRELIRMMNTGEGKDAMLNTVMYGPPGTGKSMVSVKLAKIWYSLGYLEKKSTKKNNLLENAKDDPVTIANYLFLFFMLMNFLVLILRLVGLISPKAQFYLFILIIILALYTIIDAYYSDDEVTLAKNVAKGKVDERDLVTVAERDDVIGEYLGQTTPKILSLLNKNTGKVIFFDEAYNLMSDNRDPYGKEALTAMCKYMSEHPSSCIIIFAGYKKELEKLFKAQPGLRERFMWKFVCEKYNSEELYQIFLIQCNKAGWKLENKEEILQLFYNDTELFNACGRDTMRLLNFSKTVYTDEANDLMGDRPKILTIKHIKKGIEELRYSYKLDKNNNIDDKKLNLNKLLEEIY